MSGDQPGLLSEDEYGRVVRHGRVLDSPVQVDGYDHDGRRRVAIDLPHGRALVEHGYYPLTGGIAAGLRVRERNGQLLVRVLLAQPVSRIALAVQRESLEVRLTAER